MKYNLFSKALIGLDIKPNRIQLVQLRKQRQKFHLTLSACTRLPPTIYAEGKIKQWEALVDVLGSLVQEHRLEGQAAAISLPQQLVTFDHIQVPTLSSDQAIETEIHAEIERSFPGINESLCVDFTVIRSRDKQEADVYFQAVREAYLWRYVDCLESAGLKVKIVDIDVFAIKRAILYAMEGFIYDGVCYAVVHIDTYIATLIVLTQQAVLFAQQWPFNALDFSQQLDNKIQLYYVSYPQRAIDRFFICGKSDVLTRITKAMLNSYQVSYPDLFSHITIANKLLQCADEDCWVACGTAMRESPIW